MVRTAALLAALLVSAPTTADAQARPRARPGQSLTFWATAYCVDGTTRSGTQTRAGVIAADPRVLPLGSRVRIHGIGRQRVFTVHDTGPAVKGREVDIFMEDCAAAKRFGRQKVRLRILRRGPDARTLPETLTK